MVATRKFELAEGALKRDITAWSHSRWHYLPGLTREDLEQEIKMVLWTAVQTYDPAKGAKFGTYFRRLRDHKYADLVKAASRDKRQSEVGWSDLETAEAISVELSPAAANRVLRRYTDSTTVPSAEVEVFARMTVVEHAEKKACRRSRPRRKR